MYFSQWSSFINHFSSSCNTNNNKSVINFSAVWYSLKGVLVIEVFKYIVEPRFNMQRDWGNVLVKWRVRYIEHLYITNAWEMLHR